MYSYQNYHPSLPGPGKFERLQTRIRESKLFQKEWSKEIFKRRNKGRLYVALYRGPDRNQVFAGREPEDPDIIGPVEDPDERKYTWCFLVGPKHEPRHLAVPGTRLAVTRDSWHGRWIMQRNYEVNVKNTGSRMLVRVAVGKIVDLQRMWNVLYAVPVHEWTWAYRNKAWLTEALMRLKDSIADGVMAPCSQLDWMDVQNATVSFAERFEREGRFEGVDDINVPKPAWDLMEGRYLYE
ncbi:hypothetical protein CONLIGDRAFT_679552 [Coniochaeta ligniaria NRRL 30616]|uniref:Uncharacterized protein n=1 Tax=Coniochaeta ligniaria NRRL 30616 TaxID=1408157 RepID=A0A1J7ITH9_9PEZI|nr:hypothetical protein CONLIGDRAFT_679552 [Coniochaeta ligniaria NRRL 30616]